MQISKQIIFSLAMCTLAACSSSSAIVPRAPSSGAVDSLTCAQRVNDTLSKLDACITRASLWQYLSHFQVIADRHPNGSGHGNRDTGTPGYAASVAYVARLMKRAGYKVTIQQYTYQTDEVTGTPQLRGPTGAYTFDRDWFVARRSGQGSLTAKVAPPAGSADGCKARDFLGFARGDVALLQRGGCSFDSQVTNARAAGAAAVILYAQLGTPAFQARLLDPAGIPVAGVAAYGVGAELRRWYRAGSSPALQIDIREQRRSGVDYNVIADSSLGDPNHVVVIDAHLDSIFGAGMLDNASGSTTILDVALNMAKTSTHNHLRYIWFGGEEIGLLGSHYYTTHLTQSELQKIAFDADVDVTATPNFDILIADPSHSSKVKLFPPNVVPESKLGNDFFADFFKAGGIPSRPAWFGNDGTDSQSFALVGTPDSGILTMQDCCKQTWETKIWGGFLGNYEGQVPGYDGGCVDRPNRWCDNLSNNDPFVLTLVTKTVAYVTLELANHHFAW